MNSEGLVVETEEQEIYKENIMHHYKHPHHGGILAKYTVKHRELNPLCGDDITLYLLVENGKVKNISFQGQGCAISQAAMSLLTDKAVGMSLSEVKELTDKDIFELLGIPISHTRTKCALLSLKVIQKGVEHARS